MEILKEHLIHLWMANGFISSRENLQVEDVGSMIWNELCQKSFFQDIKMDDCSGDITFKMHDLVHDLAQSLIGQECVCLDNANVTNLSKHTHHISFKWDDNLSFNKDTLKKLESLRTLLGWSPIIPTNCSLRVLVFWTRAFHLSSLGSLTHLRYLELFDIHLETIPESIYSLQKLEILKLKHSKKMSRLPKDLVCLKFLRHLVIEDCPKLLAMCPYIGKLSCLRTLTIYIVNLEKGHGLGELRDLNLGGKLEIKGLQDVGSLSEAQGANLMGKKDLQQLCLSWCNNQRFTMTPIIDAEQVIEVLKPHKNLKRLKIEWYDGLCFPSWIATLTSLVSIELQHFDNCVHLSSLGKLPSLRKLYLTSMKEVQYIDEESHDVEMMVFPSLEELILHHLPNLEGLLKVERENMFPCLSILQISECPNLELSCLPSVKKLYVDRCNNEFLWSYKPYSLFRKNTISRGGV